jgi:hypothetical protein
LFLFAGVKPFSRFLIGLFWGFIISLSPFIFSSQMADVLSKLLQSSVHHSISANAYNFPWIINVIRSLFAGQNVFGSETQSIPLDTFSVWTSLSAYDFFSFFYFLFLFLFLFALIKFRKNSLENLPIVSVICVLGYYLFAPSVHENHFIFILPLVLWALSSYGPTEKRDEIKKQYADLIQNNPTKTAEYEAEQSSALLEYSYAGIMGRSIEPVIEPLGYDWKIGIALITSFAAREVFVGTMATLYSVGEDADENSETLRNKMQSAKRVDGSPVYTKATGFSLLVFYLLAMQCMSTLAIVKKETGSWKWPVIQLVYMTAIAYVLSFLAYQIFS